MIKLLLRSTVETDIAKLNREAMSPEGHAPRRGEQKMLDLSQVLKLLGQSVSDLRKLWGQA